MITDKNIVNEIIKNINEKIYCIKCYKYRKFKNLKISYIFNETLVLFVIYNKLVLRTTQYLKKNNLIKISQMFGLINNRNEKNILCCIVLINMVEKDLCLKFWLKKGYIKQEIFHREEMK